MTIPPMPTSAKDRANKIWSEIGINQRTMDQHDIQSCIDYLAEQIELAQKEAYEAGIAEGIRHANMKQGETIRWNNAVR